MYDRNLLISIGCLCGAVLFLSWDVVRLQRQTDRQAGELSGLRFHVLDLSDRIDRKESK